MPKIVPVVEGVGEKYAIPALCNKLLREYNRYDIHVDNEPIEAKGRSGFTKAGGLERLAQLAWSRPDCAAVLILVDADGDCPETFAQEFTKRLLTVGVRCPVVTVVVKEEYEAWFLASLDTIAGKDLQGNPGLPASTRYTGDAEGKRGVKEWLTAQFPGSRAYTENADQLAMTRLIDPTLARANSRSFRRLCHAIEQILDAVDNNNIVVTPEAI